MPVAAKDVPGHSVRQQRTDLGQVRHHEGDGDAIVPFCDERPGEEGVVHTRRRTGPGPIAVHGQARCRCELHASGPNSHRAGVSSGTARPVLSDS